MRGRPKTQLVLTPVELEQLTALTLRRKTAQALALRARIVLACAQGTDNKVVASRQRVTPQTVSKWRARFVQDRLDGLLDAPRSGAPRTIDDARVDAVIAKTLESVPKQPRTGAPAPWHAKLACRRRRYRASGAHSDCSPIDRGSSSSPAIRCSVSGRRSHLDA